MLRYQCIKSRGRNRNLFRCKIYKKAYTKIMKIQAEVVNGKCPTCTEITMLVGLTPELL